MISSIVIADSIYEHRSWCIPDIRFEADRSEADRSEADRFEAEGSRQIGSSGPEISDQQS